MKKIAISIMVLLLSVICIANNSYAAGAQLKATIEISVNKTEVEAGDSVVFTLVTRDIQNADYNGTIYAIGGKIEYDSNFFEQSTASGITLGGTGLFNSTNAVTEGQTNGTITLKVKEGATGSSVVKFTQLEASDGRIEDMETLGTARTADETFTIKIKEAEVPSEPEKPENTAKPENNTTNKGNNSTTKLPQTGIGNGTVIAIVVLGILSIVLFISYRRYRDI